MKIKTTDVYRAMELRLKQLRVQLGCSRKEMAARVGLSHGSYGKCENGYYAPGIETLNRLTAEFDISLDWLFFNKGPMVFKEKGRTEELEKELAQLRKEAAGMQEKAAEMQEKAAEMQQELEQAGQKLTETENLLEQKKTAEAIAAETALSPEVKELVDSMGQVPLLHYEILAYYHRFKMENKEITKPRRTPGKKKAPRA